MSSGADEATTKKPPPPLNFDRDCFLKSHFVSERVKFKLRYHEKSSKAIELPGRIGYFSLSSRDVRAPIIFCAPPPPPGMKILDPRRMYVLVRFCGDPFD